MPVPLVLAPMAGVTDLPFRLLARECGADLTITEFTSSAGLSRDQANSWMKLESDPRESPFIPQIFGGDKVEMVTSVEMLQERADIIDLNFGCPAPGITKNCAGAALMGEPDHLIEIVSACIEASSVPITAKLRMGTGYIENNIVKLAPQLEELGVMRLCVHGRTLKQRYTGEAGWKTIADVVEAVEIPVIANGDIIDAAAAQACLDETGAAGLMIGRGAIGRPMIFNEIKSQLGWNTKEPPWGEEGGIFESRLWCWNRYVELSQETTGLQHKWLKRHALAFTKGLPGSKAARTEMARNNDAATMAEAIKNWLTQKL